MPKRITKKAAPETLKGWQQIATFLEAMRNFELQRDREFSSQVCADHPRTMGA
jgi:hypothetical protein